MDVDEEVIEVINVYKENGQKVVKRYKKVNIGLREIS